MKIPSEETNTTPTTQKNSITRMKRKETRIVCKQFEVIFEDDDDVESDARSQKIDSQNYSRYSLPLDSNHSEPNIQDKTYDKSQNDLSLLLSSQSRNGLTEMDSASICSNDSNTSDSTLADEYTIKSENENSSENSCTEDSITWEEYIREQSNDQNIIFYDKEYFTKDSYNLKSCLKNKSGDKEGRIKDEYKRSKKVLSWCSSLSDESDESDLTEENADDATIRTGFLSDSRNDYKNRYDLKNTLKDNSDALSQQIFNKKHLDRSALTASCGTSKKENAGDATMRAGLWSDSKSDGKKTYGSQKTLQSQTARPDKLLIKDNAEALSQQIFNKKHLDRSALTNSDLTEENADDATMRTGLWSDSKSDGKDTYCSQNILQRQTVRPDELLIKDNAEALSQQIFNKKHLDRSALNNSDMTEENADDAKIRTWLLCDSRNDGENKHDLKNTLQSQTDRSNESLLENNSEALSQQSLNNKLNDLNGSEFPANCITSKEENDISSAKPSSIKYQTIFKNRVITTSLTTEDRVDGSANANKNEGKVSKESPVSAFTSEGDKEQFEQPQIHDHEKTIPNKNIYELELQQTKSNLKDTKISSMNPSSTKKSIRSDDPSKTKSNLIDQQHEKPQPNSLQKKPSFTKDSYKDELQKYTKNLNKGISDNPKTRSTDSKSKLYPSTVRNEVYEINTIVHVTNGKETTRLIRYKGKDKVDDVTTEVGDSSLKLREELKANMDLLQSFIEEFNDVCRK